MKIIGHRGAAGIALENSPASIKAALALTVEAIEIDVRCTKDGQLVTIHDKHTGRVANKELWVADATLAELKKLRLNNGERLLSTDEALTLIGSKKPVILDLKSSDICDQLGPLLKKYAKLDITVSSRNYPQLRRVHEAFPKLKFTARAYIYSTDIVHIAHNLQATGISINKWVMNPLTYHLAQRAGLEMHTYTVNHPLLMRIFRKLYPELSIITDHPDRFVAKKKR